MVTKRETNNLQIYNVSNFLEENKLDFKQKIGRYSHSIYLPDEKIHFISDQKSPKCFIAYNLILKDVKLNFCPFIKENKIKYHNTNLIPIYADKIFATDINSAYANILFNEKVISENSFNYLCTLSKGERLAAVGMLATKNSTYIFEKGKLIQIVRYENPYSNIFFYAVSKVYNIMMDIKNILKEDFLYSWVDCVYYANKKSSHRIVNECLLDHKLRFKSLWLNEFEVEDLGSNYRVSYKKGDFFSRKTIQIITKLPNNKKIIL
jgi:hypothetical protein